MRRAFMEPPRSSRRRRGLVWLGIPLIALGIACGWFYYWWTQGTKDCCVTVTGEEDPVPNQLLILVLGMDVVEPHRTDTIQLFSVNSVTGHVGVLSIPRDTRVQIPGFEGYHRINVAHALARNPDEGPQLVVRTVEELLGVSIDYWVRIDYQGFVEIVDAIGGVEIDIPAPMKYTDTAQGLYIDLPAGRQRLNGEQALQYVRYRNDGLGDVSLVDPANHEYGGRVTRQLNFVRALIAEATKPANLPRLIGAIPLLLRSVDTNLPASKAVALAGAVHGLDFSKIETQVLPGTSAMIGGASYWIHDPALTREAVNRVVLGRDAMTWVQVLNGNGIQGAAARTANELRLHGYHVVGIGNADHARYPETLVIPLKGDVAKAEAVAELLGGTVRTDGEIVPARLVDDEAEILVIVGADFQG